jgi:hypothetical protein
VRDLVFGENFFTLSNCDFSSNYGALLEEILLIAKMSGYSVVFTTNRHKEPMPITSDGKKANDMIHIKYKEETVFYLTLTYYLEFFLFYEFGLNPMDEQIQTIIQQHNDHKDIMHSRYFYATTDFNEIKKVLNCALEIVKNI